METILHMTVLGTIAAGIIMLVSRGLDTWLKATWKYLLWLVVTIRFLVPVMPTSSLSLFNYIGETKSIADNKGTNVRENILEDRYVVTEDVEKIIGQDEQYDKPVINSFQNREERQALGSVGILHIWGIISICFATYFIRLHIKLSQNVQKLNRVTDVATLAYIAQYKEELKIRSKIQVVYGKSPSLVGIIKPTIILPKHYSLDELQTIILHELTHYKYKDHWIGLLQLIVITIHWFNPIAWVLVKNMNRDAELACDERVLRIVQDKKLYMETLVKLATDKAFHSYLIIGMESNKKQLKRRIEKMVHPVKNKKIISIIIAVILVGLSIALLTNKEVPTKSENTNVLILGHAEHQQQVDAILLLEINNKLEQVDVTSIPRDTKVQVNATSALSQIEGLTACKVSEIPNYSSMVNKNIVPEEVVVEEIEKLLDKEIAYYINLPSSVFADMINELGGITLDVPQDMYYEDHSQQLFIDLKQGEQKLTGEQLEMFARYRALPQGDLDRIKNQQYILQAITDEVEEKPIEAKIFMNIAKDVIQKVTTNMQIKDLTQYIPLINKIKGENIKFSTVQGEMQYEDGKKYYILD